MNFIKTEKQRTVLSLATSLIAMGLNILINFFLSPYIVATLGEEANGFTQLANNFVNYAIVLTVALNSMAGRFITVSYHRKEYEQCNKYYSSVMVGNILIILLLIVPSVFMVLNLEKLINIETANVFHVKLLFTFVFFNFYLSLVSSVFGIVFYVKNSLYLQNTITAIRYCINLLGLLLLFSLFVPAIYFVSLIALFCSVLTIAVYVLIKKKIMPDITFSLKHFDVRAIYTIISSGVWNALNQCGNLLMNGFDLLLSNLLIGPGAMGVLSVAKTIPNCIIQLGTTVNTSFSPNLTIAYAKENKKEILSSLRFSMKCSSFLISIPIMVLSVYGARFYSLWVPSMNADQLSVLSLLTCIAFIPFSGPQTLYNVYTTTNKLKLNSITLIFGGVLNIIIVLVLLKHTNLGLYAIAGVSSLISIIRNLIVTVPYSAKLLGLKWYTFYKDVAISVLCCATVGIVCWFVGAFLTANNWISFCVAVFVSCFISAIALFTILLNKQEKESIIKKIKGMKRNG